MGKREEKALGEELRAVRRECSTAPKPLRPTRTSIEAVTSTQAVTSTKPKCGAKTRSGGQCGLAAGHGTDHPGRGRCRRHGGSTRNHRKSARKAEAIEFAANALGGEMMMDPLEGLLWSVRLAAGEVAYWRLRLAIEKDAASEPTRNGYAQALDRLNRFSKAAVDGKVSDRLIAIATRTAEQIALAAEDALATLTLSAAERTAFASAFASAIARLEAQPLLGSGDGEAQPAYDVEG